MIFRMAYKQFISKALRICKRFLNDKLLIRGLEADLSNEEKSVNLVNVEFRNREHHRRLI
ncbi:MAG: hypothetical protein DWH73_00245 [Planctomycetota bacterium]|nr:MAG: hypothetical protein DWH73_00245 [Planctomycetota bacterium]